MPRTALACAIAMHAACLAATVTFVHATPQFVPSVVELVVPIVPEPPAVEPPPKMLVTARAEPNAAPNLPPGTPVAPAHGESAEPAPPEPAAVKPLAAVEQASASAEQPAAPTPNDPEETAPPEPVAAQPLAPVEQGPASAEQPAGTPPPIVPVASPPPPPPPPAHRQPRPLVARHAVPMPQVSVKPDGASVDVPQQPSARLVAQPGPTATGPAAAAQVSAPTGSANDQEASLEARIREAVQAAVHFPAAARMMGVTTRARVQLNYRNGAVNGPLLAQSSGMPMLDQAALSAAQDARYPATPPELAGRLMRFLVWVEFRSG